ncbi:MAG: SRPBCC domain-containing protein [Cyanobacteria bacterium P01_A01_bin.84]
MLRQLRKEVFYPYPPQRVWYVLTNSQALAAWLMKNDFQPCLGHKFRFQHSSLPGLDENIECEVIEIDEPSRLSYTWKDSLMHQHSIVTWTLKAVEGGTQLKLEHRNLDSRNLDNRNLDSRNLDNRNLDSRNLDNRNLDSRNLETQLTNTISVNKQRLHSQSISFQNAPITTNKLSYQSSNNISNGYHSLILNTYFHGVWEEKLDKNILAVLNNIENE